MFVSPMGGDPFSSTHSANASFSDGSSESWESATNYTPVSTPGRGSPHALKYESSVFSAPTPASSPDLYSAANAFCAMNTMTQNMMDLYHNTPSLFSGAPHPESTMDQVIPDYPYGPYLDTSVTQSFQSHHGLQMDAPSLIHDDIYSPVSDMSSVQPTLESCVAPSQITFGEFALESLPRPGKSLQFDIDYDCQGPDYDASFAGDILSPGSAGYFVPEFSPYKSEHSTPCRGPIQRQSFAPAPETEAMAPCRFKVEVESSHAKKARLTRKRPRGVDQIYDGISASIGLNPKATFACAWPGCGSKFARAEHRKRHHYKHEGLKEKCLFCEHLFPQKRRDNIKTHLKLHKDPLKGSRVKYHPGAAAELERMEAETRKGTASKARREGKNTHRITRTRS